MDKQNELFSRRAFFKKAAGCALPFLAMNLFGTSFLSCSKEEDNEWKKLNEEEGEGSNGGGETNNGNGSNSNGNNEGSTTPPTVTGGTTCSPNCATGCSSACGGNCTTSCSYYCRKKTR